jgi:hypothetical protein
MPMLYPSGVRVSSMISLTGAEFGFLRHRYLFAAAFVRYAG